MRKIEVHITLEFDAEDQEYLAFMDDIEQAAGSAFDFFDGVEVTSIDVYEE